MRKKLDVAETGPLPVAIGRIGVLNRPAADIDGGGTLIEEFDALASVLELELASVLELVLALALVLVLAWKWALVLASAWKWASALVWESQMTLSLLCRP